MKIPKTLIGISVVLLGASINLIPVIGQVAGPYVMAAGAGMIGVGGIDKTIRAMRKQDPFKTEREIIKKAKGA